MSTTRETAAQSPLDCGAVPQSLISFNPLRWLTLFGPGAIIASLTIGTGELIFSSRGGAIFGYRILFLFLLILVFKWVLVFSTARHMVLTGIHPLARWLELPLGPRGWLPGVMFVFALVCIPIWVSFHSSVLGALLADLTGTQPALQGTASYAWGILTLLGVVSIAVRGGYMALEKIQLLVVAVMLLTVGTALLLLKPDWLEMLWGAFLPHRFAYPEWMLQDPRAEIQRIVAQPVWVEASLYVGVIGGASYDYLAYTSFLRDKRWGLAGSTACALPLTPEPLTPEPLTLEPLTLEPLTLEDVRLLKLWLRAPLIDCSVSFAVVFLFSAVFVASGWLVLAPAHQIPVEGSFLEHQAQFVTQLHPWLFPLYILGTMLAMLGTLYGTLEIAPVILRESVQLLKQPYRTAISDSRLRLIGLGWTACGALAVLLFGAYSQVSVGTTRPFALTALLIPANLFTGVLSCGLICLLNPWMDTRLPANLRSGVWLSGLNLLAGSVFVFLGIKGYWEFGGLRALLILFGTIVVGWVVASLLRPLICDGSPPAETKSS